MLDLLINVGSCVCNPKSQGRHCYAWFKMNGIKIFPIGKIENDEVGFKITLDPMYKEGLKWLADYSHNL